MPPSSARSAPDLTTPRKNAADSLHPRNRHRGRYDFAQLIAACPHLARYVTRNAYGDDSIDFADAQAVRALNGALLAYAYGVRDWQLPPQYLCPPIPGRADALHYLADLLAQDNVDRGAPPRGRTVHVLDVGVGANGVYPLIGHAEYGWSFVGSDIDRAALAAAQSVLDLNPNWRAAIELRWQPDAKSIFRGVVRTGERFDLTLCNPPFHASIGDARRGSVRKWQNLGRHDAVSGGAPQLNFGGRSNELCCAGGEAAFVCRMVEQSTRLARQVLWFSSLVAKAASLRAIQQALDAAGVRERRTIAMAQGQKKSRIVAWTYLDAGQRRAWSMTRPGQT